MKSLRISAIVGAIVLGVGAISNVQAAVFTEDFEAAFPAWENNWFGLQSTARNFYCEGALGCTDRGNNPDGLWVVGPAGGVLVPVEVTFAAGFADTITSFRLDVAGFAPTVLQAYDGNGALVFSQDVALTSGAFTDPGTYSTYTIESTSGISRFTFSGDAAGNTSIDNLRLETGIAQPIPEPASVALMLAGLATVAGAVRRRKR